MVELLSLLYGGSALLLRSSRSFVLWMWMLVLHDFCNWLSYRPYAQLGVGAAVLHFPTIASLLENQRAYIADPAHAPPIGALFPITGVDATAGACAASALLYCWRIAPSTPHQHTHCRPRSCCITRHLTTTSIACCRCHALTWPAGPGLSTAAGATVAAVLPACSDEGGSTAEVTPRTTPALFYPSPVRVAALCETRVAQIACTYPAFAVDHCARARCLDGSHNMNQAVCVLCVVSCVAQAADFTPWCSVKMECCLHLEVMYAVHARLSPVSVPVACKTVSPPIPHVAVRMFACPCSEWLRPAGHWPTRGP